MKSHYSTCNATITQLTIFLLHWLPQTIIHPWDPEDIRLIFYWLLTRTPTYNLAFSSCTTI